MQTIGPWRLPWERVIEAAQTPEWCEVVDADGCTVTLLLDLELDNTDAIAAVDTLLDIVNESIVKTASAARTNASATPRAIEIKPWYNRGDGVATPSPHHTGRR